MFRWAAPTPLDTGFVITVCAPGNPRGSVDRCTDDSVRAQSSAEERIQLWRRNDEACGHARSAGRGGCPAGLAGSRHRPRRRSLSMLAAIPALDSIFKSQQTPIRKSNTYMSRRRDGPPQRAALEHAQYVDHLSRTCPRADRRRRLISPPCRNDWPAMPANPLASRAAPLATRTCFGA
jgi:hypothetical protein